MPIYNAKILKIDPVEVRRYAGLRKAEKFDEQSIIHACEEAQLLLDVRGIWNIYEYEYETQTILSDPQVIIEGKAIGKHLENCDKVICMAATVGENIEREVTKRFREGEYVYSMLLDAAATTAVEQAADLMEKSMEQQMARDGYTMRRRFSPGYGDWVLTQQPDLFKLAGADQIGMKLSYAMMLMPRKSITAIIGLVKNQNATNTDLIENQTADTKFKHDCADCDQVDCPSRMN